MAGDPLGDVLRSWRIAGELDDAAEPASDTDLQRADGMLGRELPPALRQLYAAVGGGSFAGGNLTVHPALPPGDDSAVLSLVTAGSLLRSWDWPVPDSMVVFGDNGAGDAFGVWVPRDRRASPLIVEMGEVFEERCLAVIADDLPSFLRGWTAYYYVSQGDDQNKMSPALDALDVPSSLRTLADGGTDDEFFSLIHWASPHLPDPRPDPYKRGLTADEVDEIARR